MRFMMKIFTSTRIAAKMAATMMPMIRPQAARGVSIPP